jgi:hypothetical protein
MLRKLLFKFGSERLAVFVALLVLSDDDLCGILQLFREVFDNLVLFKDVVLKVQLVLIPEP